MTTPTLKHLTVKPLLALLVTLAACSTTEILDVQDPDIINPGAVNSPAGAAALYAGAVGEFGFSVVGDRGATEGQILVSGSFTDENDVRAHGRDERILVKSFYDALDFMYKLMRALGK